MRAPISRCAGRCAISPGRHFRHSLGGQHPCMPELLLAANVGTSVSAIELHNVDYRVGSRAVDGAKESRMRSQSARRPARRVQIALSLFVAIILQVGLLTSPAAAKAPDPDACVRQGQQHRQVLSDGTEQWWICEMVGGFKHWRPGFSQPGPSAGDEDGYSASTPPYRSYLDAWIGRGYTKDFATVSYELFNPDGSTLTRTMAVRLEIHNRSSGRRCVNGVWHQTTNDHMTWTARGDWALQCGTGYYEVAVHGRFWSVSLNRWINNYWTRSGWLWLSPYV
jgi:hypothetical protein